MTGWEMLAMAAAGFAAGGINAVVGSGTLISFPVLLAVGLPPVPATISNSLGLIAGNLSGSGVDDPDAYFYEHYACGSERNYTNYCNPDLEKLYDKQSMEPDQQKRKQIVWEIDKVLTEDGARPIMFRYDLGTCRYPWVKNVTTGVNSIFNTWRLEDAWLDK